MHLGIRTRYAVDRSNEAISSTMQQNPISWNVVVIGAWNRAILTPAGIQRRLFALPPETPIEVEVAIDRPAPFRVKHKGLVVTVGSDSLSIETDVARVGDLIRAAELAQKALRELPETPVLAAGLNMTIALSDTPATIAPMLESCLDEALADQSFEIAEHKSIRRTVKLAVGQVNIELAQHDQLTSVAFNFHLSSESTSDLQTWLGQAKEHCSIAQRLASEVFNLSLDQEFSNDPS